MKRFRLLPLLIATLAPTAFGADAPQEAPRFHRDDAIVSFRHDASLEAGRHAAAVVAIMGSASSAGDVDENVVSVLGTTRVSGPVGKDVVAVGGDVYIDSAVDGDAVAVMGDLHLGPGASIGGDVVVVGGTLDRDPAAQVGGATRLVWNSSHPVELRAWFRQCLVLGRPLAFAPGLGWAWGIAAGFLLLYVLLAMGFRRAMDRCVETFETRPGRSVVAALLTMILTPVGFALVAFTIIGLALVPFLGLALACAGLFGKAVVLALIGRQFTRRAGSGVLAHTAMAVLIGGILVALLYTIPVVGFLLYKLLGLLGLGVVVYTVLLAAGAGTRERRRARAPVSMPPVAAGAGESAAGDASTPAALEAHEMLPRAGFWIRMAALAIDAVLVGIVLAFLPRHAHGLWLVLFAAYGVVMWKLRSTTIGGIVCQLQVVRVDGRPVDWATAVVRGLACFLSLFAAGLGFIWIAVDEQHQAWHDKIAGTVVLRMPGSPPLV